MRVLAAFALALALACVLGAIPAGAQTPRVPLFVPPPNWSAVSGDTITGGLQNIWQGPLPFTANDASIVGMWVGNGPMQMISLVRGKAVASPDTVARLYPPRDERYGSQVQYRVASQRYNFCGLPGTLVNIEFGQMMGFTLSYDLAVTQSGGVSYMLSYFHFAGDSDPAAQRALRSLCPIGTLPRIQS